MTNSPYVRSALAQAALELIPPLIRQTLIEDADFRKEYGFKADSVIFFDDSGVSIQRSDLFKAIRKILSGASIKNLIDKNGQRWKLKNISEEGELPILELSRANNASFCLTFVLCLRTEPYVSILLRRPLLNSIFPAKQEMHGGMFFQNALSKMMRLRRFSVSFAIRQSQRLDP